MGEVHGKGQSLLWIKSLKIGPKLLTSWNIMYPGPQSNFAMAEEFIPPFLTLYLLLTYSLPINFDEYSWMLQSEMLNLFFHMGPNFVQLTALALSDCILKYTYFYLTPVTRSLTANSVTSMKTLTTLQAGAFNPEGEVGGNLLHVRAGSAIRTSPERSRLSFCLSSHVSTDVLSCSLC